MDIGDTLDQVTFVKPTPSLPVKQRRLWLKRLLGIGLLGCLLFLLDYYAYPYGAAIAGQSRNQGDNGLWLRYTWYFGERNTTETQQLAQTLQERRIRYAFFHVRDIQKDGTLRFHCPTNARLLTETLHRELPSLKSLAWIYAGNRQGSGDVDLADPTVRKAMVAEAVWLVQMCGFDGVQWDYETSADGDPALLNLLDETRIALPPHTLISIATPMWVPAPLHKWDWSDAYFRAVASRCDQMAVMCYDSGFWLPRSYVWLVKQQAVHVTQDAKESGTYCRVLLGLPTYGAGLPSHNPRAENLRFALRGVREGLADPSAEPAAFAGIALFADYTTRPADWRTYSDLW